jgi:protein-S-isoprenylcysteine O-methyltransferase Ste14
MEHVLEPTAGSLLFWLATVLWLAEPLLFGSQAHDPSATSRRERGLMVSGILTSLAAAAGLHHLGIGNLDATAAAALRSTGLALYAAGVALRYSSAHHLGRHFTRDVHVHDQQELVTTGPYRWLRHPLYVGLFALALGLVLQFANVLATALVFALVATPIALRARREEQVLAATLPSAYPRWRATRHRVLPGLF